MKDIFAALIFFTRLPLWKFKAFQLPIEYFKNVINYWAVIGWLTSGIMVGTIWGIAQIAPLPIAIILGLLSRLLLTGALHEDGLADFFDGFGGGTTKQRILEIMKDSHIGTYGVLALVFYYLFAYEVLQNFELKFLLIVLFTSDTFSKFIASTIPVFLAYSRTEETSKNKVVYTKMQWKSFIISVLFAGLPLQLLPNWRYLLAFIAPIILYFVLIKYLKRKIGGYTGDTCGAIFLLCELTTWLAFLLLHFSVE